MLRRYALTVILLVVVGAYLPSCTVSYGFSGVSLSRDKYKTFTVYYFPNRARLVNPTLSQSFTEELREKLTRQTWMNELEDNGDIEFEGQITGYDFRPMSIAKDDQSAQTRLTITIKVKYTNHQEPEKDFEQSFSAFEDFDSSLAISSVEDELTAAIIEKLTDDIFNATIADW